MDAVCVQFMYMFRQCVLCSSPRVFGKPRNCAEVLVVEGKLCSAPHYYYYYYYGLSCILTCLFALGGPGSESLAQLTKYCHYYNQ